MLIPHPAYVFWEPEHNHRGTFNIIVTCFSTLGICLWSALHLSIPRKMRGWKESLGVKLLWMITGLLLPEFLIVAAVLQRRRAVELRDKVNTHFKLGATRGPWYRRWFQGTVSTTSEDKDEEEQTLVRHSSYLSDSSTVRSRDSTLKKEAEKPTIADEEPATQLTLSLPTRRTQPGRHRWTLVHGFYAEMGGYAIYDASGELRILQGKFIEDLLDQNPRLVPDLSKDAILDKSKADGLTKAVLFLQVGWFCVSCLNRLFQRFPLTLLEISTLAHALCSMTVYILWWDKPLNIQEPLIVSCPGVLETQDLPVREGGCFGIEFSHDDQSRDFYLVFIAISLIYGGPHLLAWNSAFTTHTERLLWRIASCIVVSIGFYAFALILLYTVILFFLSSLVYLFASLYLIGESLRQLFYLPPAAFQTPIWSNYFPHFS